MVLRGYHRLLSCDQLVDTPVESNTLAVGARSCIIEAIAQQSSVLHYWILHFLGADAPPFLKACNLESWPVNGLTLNVAGHWTETIPWMLPRTCWIALQAATVTPVVTAVCETSIKKKCTGGIGSLTCIIRVVCSDMSTMIKVLATWCMSATCMHLSLQASKYSHVWCCSSLSTYVLLTIHASWRLPMGTASINKSSGGWDIAWTIWIQYAKASYLHVWCGNKLYTPSAKFGSLICIPAPSITTHGVLILWWNSIFKSTKIADEFPAVIDPLEERIHVCLAPGTSQWAHTSHVYNLKTKSRQSKFNWQDEMSHASGVAASAVICNFCHNPALDSLWTQIRLWTMPMKVVIGQKVTWMGSSVWWVGASGCTNTAKGIHVVLRRSVEAGTMLSVMRMTLGLALPVSLIVCG